MFFIKRFSTKNKRMSIDSKDLQYAFTNMLGAEAIVRRKRRNEKNAKKDLFLSIIKKYDSALIRSMSLQSQYQLDLSKYEDPYFNIIDELILLSWGEDVYSLIAFYLYERINVDNGMENFLVGPNLEEIYIKTPEDLYNTIQKLFPETFN